MVSKKNNPIFVWGWNRKVPRDPTVCHPSASLVMPNGDPLDGFFYITLTLVMDSYILSSSEHNMPTVKICAHLMSVLCLQQLLQITSKLLGRIWPNLAGLILLWPSSIIVQMVPVWCITVSNELKTFVVFYTPKANIVLLIYTVHQKMKVELALLAIRQIFCIFDHVLWLQGHSIDLKHLLL